MQDQPDTMLFLTYIAYFIATLHLFKVIWSLPDDIRNAPARPFYNVPRLFESGLVVCSYILCINGYLDILQVMGVFGLIALHGRLFLV
jgi:hypothetical protein